MRGAYVQTATERQKVPSLKPFLTDSLGTNSVMDPALMKEEERVACRWVGCSFSKGVSSPALGVAVFGTPSKMKSGWHGELVQGFPGVDPNPRCYEPDHEKGFADFVRWVYFVKTSGDKHYFGVDYSLSERPTAGVGTSMLRVAQNVRLCAELGVRADAEVVLLNPRMCESALLAELREKLGLVTVKDWCDKGETLFGPAGSHCPGCGQDTRAAEFRFCYRCGHEH